MQQLQDLKDKYPDIDVNLDGGSDSYQEGLPIVERDPVAVIIKHPENETYLIAHWKKNDWRGFLTGGVEEGDTVEDTVRKEIQEETGYIHVAKVVPFEFVSHGLFFHPVKNENRLAHYHLVFAELYNLEQVEVTEEEKSIAEFIWIPKDEVLQTLRRNDMKSLWRHYLETC